MSISVKAKAAVASIYGCSLLIGSASVLQASASEVTYQTTSAFLMSIIKSGANYPYSREDGYQEETRSLLTIYAEDISSKCQYDYHLARTFGRIGGEPSIRVDYHGSFGELGLSNIRVANAVNGYTIDLTCADGKKCVQQARTGDVHMEDSVRFFFENSASGQRFMARIKHEIELCGGKEDPF